MHSIATYPLVDNPSIITPYLGHVAALQALVLHDNQLTEVRAVAKCLVCTFLLIPSAMQPTVAARSNQNFHAYLQIPQLGGYTTLQTLEVSYNSISSLRPLTSLQSTSLKELFVANNAVQHIEVEWQILMQHHLIVKGHTPASCGFERDLCMRKCIHDVSAGWQYRTGGCSQQAKQAGSHLCRRLIT